MEGNEQEGEVAGEPQNTVRANQSESGGGGRGGPAVKGNEFMRADAENGSWLQQKSDGWRHGERVRS